MAERLPTVSKVLSSIPSTIKPITLWRAGYGGKAVIPVLRAMLWPGSKCRVTESEASLDY